MAAVAIIGMGAVSSAGNDVNAGFDALAEGIDGLTPLTLFESGLKNVPPCGQISGPLPEHGAPHRTAALALCAAREAISPFGNRIGTRHGLSLSIITATTVAGMTRSERFYERLRKDPSSIFSAGEELAYHEPAALSGFLCEMLGGLNFFTLSTACSTGLHAAGMAKRLIESGRADVCLAVGADALSLLTVRGFASLMLIDPTGCKPFDKRRAGISLGEGAGALLFASDKAAAVLGARPIAYMSGWGSSADCHHMTAPHPTGEGAKRSMRAALAEAGLSPFDIDLVAAHGTATPDNDLAEITAMQSVFAALPPFCSMKRTLGHTLAASGIIESVFALCAMRKGCVPPTAGFEQADEAIAAAPSAYRETPIEHVLKNAFGFGGNNASAVFSRERKYD
jgi:3-oxoacyl-(acyl-carrier-protein) synthase